MNPNVDQFFATASKWQDEMNKLRAIVLECQLIEEFKWKVPCYVFNQKNIVMIHGFKEYCALLFFNGALLGDPEKLLIQQTENVQSGRQIRFQNLDQIHSLEPILKAYIFEAIEVAKSGLKVELKKHEDFQVPIEFQKVLANDHALKVAFERLTPGRQRAYFLHFSAPKQVKTRESRIEKAIPLILKGKGLNDCTCGLSKKYPYCDGSHKFMNQ